MTYIKKVIVFLIFIALIVGGYWFSPLHVVKKVHQYRTEKIETGTISKNISANGTLNPVVLVNVGTQISGVVNKLNVDFNDRVQKNKILAEIDPSLINAQLAQSEANLANSQSVLKLTQANEQRARSLYAKDYIARADLDQAIQALESAKAQFNMALGQLKRDKTNRDYTIIRSPVSGVIVSRNVDIGQTVAASFQTPTLFTIAQDLKKMQIDSSVAEADIGGVSVGQSVNFTVDAYPEKNFQGKVRRIRLDSKVLQNVVTYDVVVDVDNADEVLLPGMTAFISIVIEEKHAILKLPIAAFKFTPINDTKIAEKQVYRLDGEQVTAVPVKTGIADGKYIEIIAGDLKEGDAIILEDKAQKFEKRNKDATQSNFRVKPL